VVKWIGQGLQNVERLGWCKDDCPVGRFATGFNGQYRILRDPLVEDADFVDAAHNSAHLRNRGLCKFRLGIQRLKPTLNRKRLDVLRDVLAPTVNEVIAHEMFHDGRRIL